MPWALSLSLNSSASSSLAPEHSQHTILHTTSGDHYVDQNYVNHYVVTTLITVGLLELQIPRMFCLLVSQELVDHESLRHRAGVRDLLRGVRA